MHGAGGLLVPVCQVPDSQVWNRCRSDPPRLRQRPYPRGSAAFVRCAAARRRRTERPSIGSDDQLGRLDLQGVHRPLGRAPTPVRSPGRRPARAQCDRGSRAVSPTPPAAAPAGRSPPPAPDLCVDCLAQDSSWRVEQLRGPPPDEVDAAGDVGVVGADREVRGPVQPVVGAVLDVPGTRRCRDHQRMGPDVTVVLAFAFDEHHAPGGSFTVHSFRRVDCARAATRPASPRTVLPPAESKRSATRRSLGSGDAVPAAPLPRRLR